MSAKLHDRLLQIPQRPNVFNPTSPSSALLDPPINSSNIVAAPSSIVLKPTYETPGMTPGDISAPSSKLIT